jgi:hypothetical protein
MRLHFNKRTLKDSADNVCAAFGVKSSDCQDELKKVQSIEFNIFQVRDTSGGNELVLCTMTILLRENLFSQLGVNHSVFVSFL